MKKNDKINFIEDINDPRITPERKVAIEKHIALHKKCRQISRELLNNNDNCKKEHHDLGIPWYEDPIIEKYSPNPYELNNDEWNEIKKIHGLLVRRLNGFIEGGGEYVLGAMIECYIKNVGKEPIVDYFEQFSLHGKYYVRIVMDSVLYRLLQYPCGVYHDE